MSSRTIFWKIVLLSVSAAKKIVLLVVILLKNSDFLYLLAAITNCPDEFLGRDDFCAQIGGKNFLSAYSERVELQDRLGFESAEWPKVLGKPRGKRKTAKKAQFFPFWLRIFWTVKWRRKRRLSYQIFVFRSIRNLSVFCQSKANIKNFWDKAFVIGLTESRKIFYFYWPTHIRFKPKKRFLFCFLA